MGIFGSDYPPGCHSVPGDEEGCPCPWCGAREAGGHQDKRFSVRDDDDKTNPQLKGLDGKWWLFCSRKCRESYRLAVKELRRLERAEAKLPGTDPKIKPQTADEFFEIAPEGDFKWEDQEAGDWTPYNCGESDCPVGWHKVADALNMGRENGKRWVECMTVDEDGDWDCSEGWDEREGSTAKEFADISVSIQNRGWEWFKGVLSYELWQMRFLLENPQWEWAGGEDSRHLAVDPLDDWFDGAKRLREGGAAVCAWLAKAADERIKLFAGKGKTRHKAKVSRA